jgi:hypothetical protein
MKVSPLGLPASSCTAALAYAEVVRSAIQFSQNSVIRELTTAATPQTVVNVFCGEKNVLSHLKSSEMIETVSDCIDFCQHIPG